MELKIFTKNDCEFCSQVVLHKEVHTTIINIDDEDYRGFKPEQVPVLQYNGVNFTGPPVINEVLTLVKNAQDGHYKK